MQKWSIFSSYRRRFSKNISKRFTLGDKLEDGIETKYREQESTNGILARILAGTMAIQV
jgi:hypothetical protein